jgi:hypothetical protein
MTAGADRFEHDDAAYVLGALSHEDRIAYEEHLQHCPRCSAAVAELAMMPGLLARAPGPSDGADPAEQPPETVLPGLLARMRRSRRRRRIVGAAAGVAAAAALVGGTALVTAAVSGDAQEATAAGVPVDMVGNVPVYADLHLQEVAWGTKITMTCRYDGPTSEGTSDPEGVTYQLVLVAADNATQNVASWESVPGKDATVAGSTDLSPDEITEFELRDGSGKVLMVGSPPR